MRGRPDSGRWAEIKVKKWRERTQGKQEEDYIEDGERRSLNDDKYEDQSTRED